MMENTVASYQNCGCWVWNYSKTTSNHSSVPTSWLPLSSPSSEISNITCNIPIWSCSWSQREWGGARHVGATWWMKGIITSLFSKSLIATWLSRNDAMVNSFSKILRIGWERMKLGPLVQYWVLSMNSFIRIKKMLVWIGSISSWTYSMATCSQSSCNKLSKGITKIIYDLLSSLTISSLPLKNLAIDRLWLFEQPRTTRSWLKYGWTKK